MAIQFRHIFKHELLFHLFIGVSVGIASFLIQGALGGFESEKIYHSSAESILHAVVAAGITAIIGLCLKISPSWSLIKRLDKYRKEGNIQKPLDKLLRNCIGTNLKDMDDMEQEVGKTFPKVTAMQFYTDCFQVGTEYEGTDLNVPSEFIKKDTISRYYNEHREFQKRNGFKKSNRILLISREDLHYDFLLNQNEFVRCYIDHMLHEILLFSVDKAADIIQNISREYNNLPIKSEFGIWRNNFALDTEIIEKDKIWIRIGLPEKDSPRNKYYESLISCFNQLKDSSSQIAIYVKGEELSSLLLKFLENIDSKKESGDLRTRYESLLGTYLKEKYLKLDIEKTQTDKDIIKKYLLDFIGMELIPDYAKGKDNSPEMELVLLPQYNSIMGNESITFKPIQRDPIVDPFLSKYWEEFENCPKRIEKTLPFIKKILGEQNFQDILDTRDRISLRIF